MSQEAQFPPSEIHDDSSSSESDSTASSSSESESECEEKAIAALVITPAIVPRPPTASKPKSRSGGCHKKSRRVKQPDADDIEAEACFKAVDVIIARLNIVYEKINASEAQLQVNIDASLIQELKSILDSFVGIEPRYNLVGGTNNEVIKQLTEILNESAQA